MKSAPYLCLAAVVIAACSHAPDHPQDAATADVPVADAPSDAPIPIVGPDNTYCDLTEHWQGPSSDGVASLPTTCVYTALSGTPSPGATIPIGAGGDIGAAIGAASCGDTIVLAAGSVYPPFTVPAKACDAAHWITVRTSATDLPDEGHRVSPCWSGTGTLPGRPAFACPVGGPTTSLARIVMPHPSGRTIQFATGANHVRFIGLEVTRAAGGAVTELVEMTGADHVIFDRTWIHGSEVAADETTRGVQLNTSTYVAVIDSYFDDFVCLSTTGACTDAQAIAGGNQATASHTYKIVDNFLEAAAENILFGGGGSTYTSSDLEIRRNWLFKPMTWNPMDPSYVAPAVGSHGYIVKNLFELKNAQRVLFEGNILENIWGGFSQVGAFILLTPKNQAGKCDTCSVRDITIRFNHGKNGGQALQIANVPDDPPTLAYAYEGNRYSIHDDLFEGIQYANCFGCIGAGATPFQNELLAGTGNSPATDVVHDLTIDHVTEVSANPAPQGFLTISGPPASGSVPQSTNIRITNSIVMVGTFAVHSSGGAATNCTSGVSTPKAIFDACWPSYAFAGNVLVGSAATTWPSGNMLAVDQSTLGYASFNAGAGGDYHLGSASPYKATATDGKDPGADLDLVVQYTQTAM